MKRFLWSWGLILLLVGCGKGEGSPEVMDTGSSECRLLNEKLVYSEDFAEKFGLPVDEANVLESELLAVRLYWTELSNPLVGESRRPSLHAQFYLKESVPLHLAGEEGTLSDYETRVRSGFRYFEHAPPEKGEAIVSRDFRNFRHRVIAVDRNRDAINFDIHRYKRPLIPGVQVVEVGVLLDEPFHIFFYIGEDQPSEDIEAEHFWRVQTDIDDYDRDSFVRFRFPEELEEVLKEPYACSA